MNGPSPHLRRHRPRPRSVPALIESLEGRRLMAAGTVQTQLLINVDSGANFPLRTIQVTVHKVFANPAPITGEVTATYQVNDGPVISLGPEPVGADGVATFLTQAPLPNGSATTFTAAYSGDSTYAASTNPGFVLIIPGISTTTTLAALPNPSSPGQPVTFTAVVASDGQGFGVANDTVTFTVDGQAQPPVPITVTNGFGQATFTTSSLAAGSHVVTASYNATGANDPYGSSTSAPLTQLVQSAVAVVPPAVTAFLRFGFHRQPTSLVLAFNQALDAASAQDTANYLILGPGGRRIGVRRAIYDAASQTVTLSPAQLLNIHRTYHLAVIASTPTGVKGANGVALDGAGTGQAGTNYVAAIDRATLVLPPAPVHLAAAHPNAHLAAQVRHASARGVKTR